MKKTFFNESLKRTATFVVVASTLFWGVLGAASFRENGSILRAEENRSQNRVLFPRLGAEVDADDHVRETSSETGTNSASSVPSTREKSRVGIGENVEPVGKTPLSPTDDPQNGERDDAKKKSSFWSAAVSAIGALAIVLGVFFALIYLLKLLAPNKFNGASGVLEVVDSCAVGGKFEATTIRWGRRLVLVARSSEKITPLCETSDPEEIAEILTAAKQKKLNAPSEKTFWKSLIEERILIPIRNSKKIAKGQGK